MSAVPDIVTIGPHRLYLGDAYAIRPTLGWMDADVTDPPYEFRAEGGGEYRKARNGNMDQIVREQLHKGFDHRIINPLLCGAAVVFCHNDQLSKLLPYLDGLFERFALCMWRKRNPQPFANKHYRPDVEFYVHCWSRGYHPQGDIDQKDRVIEAYSVRREAKFGHPTVKPDSVMDKIITNIAGRTVCDPFMGTGSTGVAAIKAGLIFTGIEHNPDHFATAVARVTQVYEAALAKA
ncbi:DNA modification methylase [Blastomonas sp. CACIA14H2]|uniref:DNA modification methylase n=1 Tax=Blastomonas sp. CACIA14H2 TaxID=1419876 RepID=UPI0004CF1DBD